MRRQATHSLWPYFGLLLCLFFLSLCATQSWYVSKYGRAGRGVSPSDRHNPAALDGPELNLDDPNRIRHEPIGDVAPPVLAAARGENHQIDLLTSVRYEVAALVSTVQQSSLFDSKLGFGGQRHEVTQTRLARQHAPAMSSVAAEREAGPLAPPAVTTMTSTLEEPSSRQSPPEAADTVETRLPLAAAASDTEPDTPQVRISDPNDRLAIRPRPFGRRLPGFLRGAREAGTPPVVVMEDGRFKWLEVEPTSLIERLRALEAGAPPVSQWSEGVRAAIERIYREPPADAPQLAASLSELRRLAAAAPLSDASVSPEERDKLHLARAAVERRMAIWEALSKVDVDASAWQAAGNRVVQSASELRQHMRGGSHAQKWVEYLLLEDVVTAWRDNPERDDKQVRHLIERLSDRLENPDVSDAQLALLATPPFAAFGRNFGDWAAATVDFEILCKAIEAYETRGGDLYATRVAADARLLSLASQAELRDVAEAIDRHYRAANLRLAVTGEFLQRMIPEQPLLAEPVRETIAGAAVAGQSLTETAVRVLLIPDPGKWRIGLQVTGDVAAATSSTSGPATFHSAARTEYLAKKLIVLTPTGLFSFPAVAGADAENMLRAIDTSFDGIPLIEGLVRSIVINQHEKSQRQAMAEVESKVSRKARQRLDSELDERLVDVASRVRRDVLNPLVGLGLEPETKALETTDERITTQVRLAAARQLAAHTPRVFALSDSLLSVQAHQSLLNNFLEKLELSDRKLTLPELYAEIATRLGRDAKVPEDVSRTARIHFARRDPVAVSFEQGRVHVTLSLREVADRRRSFHDFKVHAYYRPETDGLQARLLRDGVIEIDGRALPTGDYMILQGVFVSLFSDSRPFSLVNDERARDPRLAGLMISQIVLDEGWLGLALGPAHPRRAAMMTPVQR